MSALEDELLLHIKLCGLPTPVREYTFAKPRRWRFDLAWVDRKWAVEVEGGTWVSGRHSRGAGYEKDCEKANAACLAGWKVLRFTNHQVEDRRAIETIMKLFEEIGLVPDKP